MLAYAPDWDVTDGGLPALHRRPLAHRDLPQRRPGHGRPDGRPARPRPPRGRHRLRQGRAPGPGPRQPAVRRAAGAAGAHRLRRPRRRRGQHPPRDVGRRTGGRPRRGAGLHPRSTWPPAPGSAADARPATARPRAVQARAVHRARAVTAADRRLPGPAAPPAPEPRRRGRPAGSRAGDPGTRDRILAAARAEFAERGYDQTSDAGDRQDGRRRRRPRPPLLRREGTGLRSRRSRCSFDRHPACPNCRPAARDDVGERLARYFLGVWENPATRAPLLAVLALRGHQRAAPPPSCAASCCAGCC